MARLNLVSRPIDVGALVKEAVVVLAFVALFMVMVVSLSVLVF